ncbi:FAD-dependent monooxygenase [Nocardia pseudovaccinii]|uniref:FAD-dependent monooxygenase n=1 Tax=Nocardia pseudovaccinii TaxID=189540 RepID=UPI003D942ABE
MNETFDVIVAGAGPVGLMLACELRLGGTEVLVVERLTEPDVTIKAGAINVPTAQAFYRRGMLPDLLEQQHATVQRIRAAGMVPKASGQRLPIAGHFAGIVLRADEIDFDDPVFAELGPGAEAVLVAQQAIEAILTRRATELGIEIRRGAALTDFNESGTAVTVHLGDSTVRANWLVGCDGGHSTVRKLGGFDFPGLDPEITGHQGVVDMIGAESVRPGWNTTQTGIYTNGPIPGRIVTVELDGPPADRTTPVTAVELQASLRAVSGVPVEITAVHSATRFTDNTRQVTDYRKGRVLLAGDAAHVHSPFGGQGLNLGIGDAVNLGWKLAAVVRGDASETLLDTYTAERHPVGAWVLKWTRAQVALMRLDQRSKALREVVTDLLGTRDGSTAIFKRIAGVLHRYDLGGDHHLIGAVAPDIELSDGSRLGAHCADGRAILLDLADSAELRTITAPWSDRVRVVTAKPVAPRDLSAMLIRPDGYVAWAADSGERDGLGEALRRWFGDKS